MAKIKVPHTVTLDVIVDTETEEVVEVVTVVESVQLDKSQPMFGSSMEDGNLVMTPIPWDDHAEWIAEYKDWPTW